MLTNKLSPEIFNVETDNLAKLAAMFPTAVKDGAVDFVALREELGQFEEVDSEKYELTWAGKQAAKKLSQTDVVGRTLKYVPGESKDADTTQNLYIEGDNLEVLKLLRQNYYGAIKMIYIDPPYNTGNDFVYRDNFTQSQAESDEAEGETIDGERMMVNQKSGNRFHANWLNMVYPRLRIAKDLLNEKGVIFISIGDDEIDNTLKLCDEIFERQHRLGIIVWKARVKPVNIGEAKYKPQNETEYIVAYEKSVSVNKFYPLFTGSMRSYPKEIDDRRYRLATILKSNRGNNFRSTMSFEAEGYAPPDGQRWQAGETEIRSLFKSGHIEFQDGTPFRRYYEDEEGAEHAPFYCYMDKEWASTSEIGKQELSELVGEFHGFDTVKPTVLLRTLIMSCTKEDDTIIDFFSGSATTAHALIQRNAEDGGKRKFILVQYPELCNDKCKIDTAPITDVCELGKERIHRAGEKIKAEIENANKQLKLGENPREVPDIGFRVFRVADTNIRWTHDALKGQLDLDENMLSQKDRLDFMPGYTDIDVVYEILLRQRDIPLSSKVKKLGIGNRTYMFADAYVVCLEDSVTVELVEALSEVEPTPIKYVFRDSAFDDDISLKDETIRRLEAYIARNSGEQKKVYTVEFL